MFYFLKYKLKKVKFEKNTYDTGDFPLSVQVRPE